ncbi:MAG TPA: GNAT family N-acetyltransferase [Thermoanaerobaculia bacterium]
MVRIRLAIESDRPALAELIPVSARGLSRGYYSDAQTESAILHVFGTDSRLIADGTYFVAEEVEDGGGDGRLVGCGGWSRRRTLYGGDQMKSSEDPLLDPETEPARIRAFFVRPDCARRGIGSRILQACLDAAGAAGFRRVTLASTLPGVPFYEAFGFEERERFEIPLPEGVNLPIVRMERAVSREP